MAERAAVVLLTDFSNTKVFLAQRAADALRFPETWECPGGKCEQHERSAEAAERELHEETGLPSATPLVHRGRVMLMQSNHRDALPVEVDLFSAVAVVDPKNTEPGKRGEWLLFPVEEAVDLNLAPATRVLLAIHYADLITAEGSSSL